MLSLSVPSGISFLKARSSGMDSCILRNVQLLVLRQRVRLVWTSWLLFSVEKVVITSLLACTIADAGTSLKRGPDESGRHAAAVLSVVFGIGLKYSRRLDIKGVQATILLKSTKQMCTYVIYALDLLLFCSSASFYDPIDPEEGFHRRPPS